jgi:hypothetical protein
VADETDFYATGPTPGAGLRPPRAVPARVAPAPAEPVRAAIEQQPVVHPAEAAPPARGVRPTLVGAAVVAVLLLIGFGTWTVLRPGSSSSEPPAPARSNAVRISVDGLRQIAAVGIPIYWAGERPGITYELTKTGDNRVFIRYLPAGVPVGSDGSYLTIATYPLNDAFAVTSKAASRAGAVRIDGGDGVVAFYDRSRPGNVYLAYRGSSSQIEVYDPSAAEAQQLVSSGQIGPVSTSGPSTIAGARAVSAAELASFAASLQHPVYWAGAEPGVRYELSRSSSGRVYLRYLPAGATVGTSEHYLGIGTYPMKDALALTRTRSKARGAVRIKVAGGGVAFYERSRPTNVYVAYPGDDVQIEIFDPSPARARDVVTSGRLTTVE